MRSSRRVRAAARVCSTLGQVIAGQGEQSALGSSRQDMAGATDPLQQGGDGPWRTELAHQVDIADVDAELQGCGRHQGV